MQTAVVTTIDVALPDAICSSNVTAVWSSVSPSSSDVRILQVRGISSTLRPEIGKWLLKSRRKSSILRVFWEAVISLCSAAILCQERRGVRVSNSDWIFSKEIINILLPYWHVQIFTEMPRYWQQSTVRLQLPAAQRAGRLENVPFLVFKDHRWSDSHSQSGLPYTRTLPVPPRTYHDYRLCMSLSENGLSRFYNRSLYLHLRFCIH